MGLIKRLRSLILPTEREPLRSYLYFNEEKIEEMAGQIEPQEREVEQTSMSFVLSFTGPKLETHSSTRVRPATVHEKIQCLIDHLDATGNLGRKRPVRRPRYLADETSPTSNTPRFILERTSATKVIIPPDFTKGLPGIDGIAIWVSEPEAGFELLKANEWDFTGTFLYLTQIESAKPQLANFYSGCSALQAISNVVEGLPGLAQHPSGYEPLGRDSSAHPLTKLKSIGGVISLKRQIECLYSPQYMTNEQVFETGGECHRVNDLLAYPLFIAELV